jgi:hypothetical protein
MPGIADEIDGAMQQAPQPVRQPPGSGVVTLFHPDRHAELDSRQPSPPEKSRKNVHDHIFRFLPTFIAYLQDNPPDIVLLGVALSALNT